MKCQFQEMNLEDGETPLSVKFDGSKDREFVEGAKELTWSSFALSNKLRKNFVNLFREFDN